MRTGRGRVLHPVNPYWHALHEQTSRVYPREHIAGAIHSVMLRDISIAPGQVTRAGCRPLAVAPLALSASCQGSEEAIKPVGCPLETNIVDLSTSGW